MNTPGLKVLMIGSDRKLYEEGSAVRGRAVEYGDRVAELHIVLQCNASHGLSDLQIAKNVWVYPTSSSLNILRPLDAARIGKRLIQEKKFVRGQSVITAQDPFECGWAGLQIKKKWRLPLEVQLHTDPFSPYFSGFQNRVRKFYARRILRRADTLRVVSKILKEKISAITKAPISVLPIYVDRQKIEAETIKFDVRARYGWRFALLSVARLAPEKNLELAIKVLAGVRKKYQNAGLVIVGNGPEENKLKALVNKLKQEGFVEFVGWQNDLISFYKTSNVFLQTSKFEGYGLALLEAGISGIPIVTTRVGIAHEFVNEREACIIQNENIEQFVSVIFDLIENNFKRENLQINMKKTLDSLLISKEEFLNSVIQNWQKTATLAS